MGESESKKHEIPPWGYVLAILLGAPLAGGGSAILVGGGSSPDLERLERKVDALDEKIDALEIAIVRAHANDPGFGRKP